MGEATATAGGLGSARLKQAMGKGWVTICSPRGTDGGVGAGWVEAGAEVGTDGTTAAGNAAGRRILNFRNMKATELWKLVLGEASVVTGSPGSSGASITAFFGSGRSGTVFPMPGTSVAAVGLAGTTGLGTLTGEASATDFFTLKSRATSSLSEQCALEGAS